MTSAAESSPPNRGLILGIESSCDETAAAVVGHGTEVLSNVVASQIALHAAYGGVVPELASREHLRNIVPVVRQAIAEAGIAFRDLDAVAVTEGPGLAGALLVGILYAKALAFGLNKPLIAVNHLEGHIHAVVMDARRRGDLPAKFPLLALVVSGGHTHLYLAAEHPATGAWTYRNVGRTVDDAAGEAFDKVAKLLGLGYPGGPWIDALAPHGTPHAITFNFHPLKPDASGEPRFDFSFSGIKTAVLRYTQTHAMAESIAARQAALAATPHAKPADALYLLDRQTLDLIASFQAAVVGNLMRQTFAAAEAFGAHGLLVSGGVAANRELRRRFMAEAAGRGLRVAFPSLVLSTDNAAMIAAAAWPRLRQGMVAPEAMSAQPQLRLGEIPAG
jgi:N6-L-threonylcarbamoyladenine synthase